MTHTLNGLSTERHDEQLSNAVRHQLDQLTALTGTQIFVAVDRGAVTLYGRAQYRTQAELAERCTLGVPGVVAVAEELIISEPLHMNDTDIARLAARALTYTAGVPATIRVTVQANTLTLSGEVNWQYERDIACRAVNHIDAVHTVINAMTVRSDAAMAELEGDIAAALASTAPSGDIRIAVTANGRGAITLEGVAPTTAARRQASALCWVVPGVTAVHDHLVVDEPGR